MVACFEVFQTWDDEYEKLQVLLRDIVKRKREENLKMVWRINPAHRKLQARLDQMRKFRRQHEQLRAVIVRVLRPQVWLTVWKFMPALLEWLSLFFFTVSYLCLFHTVKCFSSSFFICHCHLEDLVILNHSVWVQIFNILHPFIPIPKLHGP